MTGSRRGLLWSLMLCTAGVAFGADPPAAARKLNFSALDQFSESIQALSSRVAPSVVQVLVTRYGPLEDSSTDHAGLVLDRQQSLGSGVIVDPDGYIVTNAHVVSGAQRIRVSLVSKPSPADDSVSAALAQPFAAPQDATLVGTFSEGDLALIKIAAAGLPSLPFADYKKLRQGQVVFAFGSRQGLSNSVSMGIVSSVARQPDADTPFIYIQTDAPINPGDSGGPLINTAGEIVGLNTFILSKSGGSEGLGFAIPSPLVELVSDQLRKHGHVHRQMIGLGVQTITPVLAAALHLPRDSGVMVSDLQPGGSGETAGVKLNDIVLTIDGKEAVNLPLFMMAMLTHPHEQPVALELLRGGQKVSVKALPLEESHKSDRITDLIDPEKSLVRRLGVIGIGIDERTAAMFPDLRGSYGVFVVARSGSAPEATAGIQVGDVIHEVNGHMVSDVDGLRKAVESLQHGAPVALFVERDRKLLYVSFEMD